MSKVSDLLSALAENAQSESERAGIYRLLDLVIRRVDVVDRPANRRPWLVVKRGDEMPHDEIDFSGPEIDENENGDLTAVGKADDEQGAETAPETEPEQGEEQGAEGEVEKAMAPPMKAKALSGIKGIMDRIESGALDEAGASKALSALAGSLGKAEGETKSEKADDPEADADKACGGKKKKKADDADKAETKKAEGDEEPDAIEAAIESELSKRGAKMSASNRETLKGIMGQLRKLLDSVEPDEKAQVEAMITAAVGKVEKRVGESLTDFENRIVSRVTSALAAGGTEPTTEIPDGQSASDEGETVAKSDDEQPLDDFAHGVDFNDPDQWGSTADPKTTFFTNG